MSHTTTVKGVSITALETLDKAVLFLHPTARLLKNEEPKLYYADQKGNRVCERVYRLDGVPYDLGVYKNSEGNFEFIYDAMGGKTKAAFGNKHSDLGKLLNYYIVEEIRSNSEDLLHAEFSVTESDDGTITVEVAELAGFGGL